MHKLTFPFCSETLRVRSLPFIAVHNRLQPFFRRLKQITVVNLLFKLHIPKLKIASIRLSKFVFE
jgi:hypothetical protein